jgi:prevent-host-death family protein
MARKPTHAIPPAPSTPPSLDEYPQVSSTQLQNRFGGVMETLRTSGTIVIERHERPAAVLLSIEEFDRLRAGAAPARQLDMLTAEFDALVANLQSPQVAAGLQAAFSATPAALAKAAAPGIRASLPANGSRRSRRK